MSGLDAEQLGRLFGVHRLEVHGNERTARSSHNCSLLGHLGLHHEHLFVLVDGIGARKVRQVPLFSLLLSWFDFQFLSLFRRLERITAVAVSRVEDKALLVGQSGLRSLRLPRINKARVLKQTTASL